MCIPMSHTMAGQLRSKLGDPGMGLVVKMDRNIFGKEAVDGYTLPEQPAPRRPVSLFTHYASKQGGLQIVK